MDKETAIAKYDPEKYLVFEEKDKIQAVLISEFRKTHMPEATDDEVTAHIAIIRAFGFHPYRREIHWVLNRSRDRNGNWVRKPTSIVSYEVYIKRANAIGTLNGYDVRLSPNGDKAVITIHRKDWDHPFVWEVDREEFDRGFGPWKIMPKFMLKKVAIGQGMRLAFPDEMGGMPYMPEELPPEMTGGVADSKQLSQPRDITKDVTVEPPKEKKKAPAKKKAAPKKKKEEPKKEPPKEEEKEKEEREIDDLPPIVDELLLAEVEHTGGTLSEEIVNRIVAAFNEEGLNVMDLESHRGPIGEWAESDKLWFQKLIDYMINGEGRQFIKHFKKG